MSARPTFLLILLIPLLMLLVTAYFKIAEFNDTPILTIRIDDKIENRCIVNISQYGNDKILYSYEVGESINLFGIKVKNIMFPDKGSVNECNYEIGDEVKVKLTVDYGVIVP